MSAWTRDELDAIGGAEELDLASVSLVETDELADELDRAYHAKYGRPDGTHHTS